MITLLFVAWCLAKLRMTFRSGVAVKMTALLFELTACGKSAFAVSLALADLAYGTLDLGI